VIAEGVETRDQLTFLQAEGCCEAQGFYLSRPLIAQQLAQVLKTGETLQVVGPMTGACEVDRGAYKSEQPDSPGQSYSRGGLAK
jgi:predicted signal transduction protein with EAL and GGDEF domain